VWPLRPDPTPARAQLGKFQRTYPVL